MGTTDKYDAIIAGAGHNGLTTACYLQKAGLKTLVVEKNDYVGGAAVSRELHKGWTYSNCSYVCSLLRQEIVRDLELPRFGLQVIPYEGNVTLAPGGEYFGAYGNHDAYRREMERFSVKDADAYDRFSRIIMRQCRFIRPFLLRTAPDPTSLKPRDLGELLFMIKRMWDLGRREIDETLRFWTMSIGDMLDEHFETDLIKAGTAGSGIIGTGLGVYSPGTAYVLLHHYMGDVDGSVGAWGFARGGMGAITRALAAAFTEAGGEIRCGSGVAEIRVSGGRATGVLLDNGDSFQAPVVASNMDVKRTMLKHVGREHLPAAFAKAVENFKIRGSSGKINIALDRLPTSDTLPDNGKLFCGDYSCTESLRHLEKAYDEWKDGYWSSQPYFDMLIPSKIDPTMAPPGKHMMTVFTQYAPYDLNVDGVRSPDNWNEETRAAFAKSIFDRLECVMPDIRDCVVHAEVRTPLDIEREVGLTEGNIFQGELTFDQLLFNRPVPGYAQYDTPVDGLYIVGSSSHPGGGVMAAPGANAAREILRRKGLGRRMPKLASRWEE
ncbi:phytoene desaturase family protein [Ruegeria marina]|uniref:Pyridine nucleotide-disulfide oxidoreductase domain-containing protein 2 n=1 Tax=Ruegeria marina TaxID=639004 RepID=A0A1G6WY31_9RHOB|nr:NAD(P)/FAD-dependent oxidoreductase [Ruegeria marina]SDD70709.1 Phytoene dehydrogenase-related protein [Ruegeria marina]